MNFCILIVFIEPDQKLIVLELEANVEVAEEDRTESILVERFVDALETELALSLVGLVRRKVASGLDDHDGVMDRELQVVVFVEQVLALIGAYQYGTLLDLYLLNGRVNLLQHESEVPELRPRNLDKHTSGINVGVLRPRNHLQVLAIVHKIIKHDHPTRVALVGIPVHRIFAALNVRFIQISESNCRHFVFIQRVFIIYAYSWLLDLLALEEIHYVAILIALVRRTQADEAFGLELSFDFFYT